MPRRSWSVWRWRIGNWIYKKIDVKFRPRQRWLTKEIPRTWCDKVELIPRLLFASLIHFWEENGEGGEAILRFQYEVSYDPEKYGDYFEDDEASANHHAQVCRQVYDDLKAAYEWAKVRAEIYDSLTELPFGIWNERELEYNKLDDLHMTSIVKHHRFMWT